MHAVSVGPWAFAVGVMALLGGLAAAHGANAFLKPRGYPSVAAPLWVLAALAVAAARAAWVVRWWPAYRAAPLRVLDVRDGGFIEIAGVVVLVFAMLVWAHRRPAWRRALPISAGCGLAAWALVGMVATQLQATTHPPLPDVSLHDLDGRTTALTALVGKPMVINLWATWCPPCRAELPMLVAASENQHAARFVFVDQGESAAVVRAFLGREGLTPGHVLVDGNAGLARYYRALGYPTTLFVDAAGRLEDTHVGPLSEASLRVYLARLVPAPQE